MSEERDKVSCRKCELVQWSDREQCRRCGASLPQPIVKIVERVVDRVVFQPYTSCMPRVAETEGALDSKRPAEVSEIGAASDFPTMAEMERTMILAAYEKSNRKALEAARLLGIGKTTVYRKLREIKKIAA